MALSAFEIYLRTGRRTAPLVQFKYNPWHDPEDGRFTFANQGNYFPGGRLRGGLASPSAQNAVLGSGRTPQLTPAQFRTNPRVRIGGNGGPPLHDPHMLEHVFPGLSRAPGGAIIGLADNILDLGGPARVMTTELSRQFANRIEKQIQALDPSFRADSLEPGGFPSTNAGQTIAVENLRRARARAFYDKGELRPLQIETLRFVQRTVDEMYEAGLKKLRAGRLAFTLSEREGLGNYIDRRARSALRAYLDSLRIPSGPKDLVRINAWAPNTPEGHHTVPDSRVGSVAFDVSLRKKTLADRQVRRFFRSDFKPTVVVIIRPSQLGSESTYVITRPQGR